MEQTDVNAVKPTDLGIQGNPHLLSSMTSSFADTPGDSGVQCLDSEASDATSTSQALMSHSLVGTEELACDATLGDMTRSDISLTRSDIDNQNVASGFQDDIFPEIVIDMKKASPMHENNLPDVVLKAYECEKDCQKKSKDSNKHSKSCEPKKSLSEDIVYRRKCRKKSLSGHGSQKKRVSFHEDILNSTRTDNIHIERGFVTYGSNGSHSDKFKNKEFSGDRFSWCASGDNIAKPATDVAQQTMSDSFIYSENDKTGVFEYDPDHKTKSQENDVNSKRGMYSCDSNSSDSNFSCESESSSDSAGSNENHNQVGIERKSDKTQKSYSCDFENNNGVGFMRKMYFSEADIDQPHESPKRLIEMGTGSVKSVLKKNRYIPTNIIEENNVQRSRAMGILETGNIIDSLKSFYKNFNFKLTPEKGLPETAPSITHVVEALPFEVSHNTKLISKSLDSGLQIDDDDDFVEISLVKAPIDDSMQTLEKADLTNMAIGSASKENSPRHKLTLNMKSKPNDNFETFPDKYVVNGESTVYEHKGVSYCYVHDPFQTSFEAPKEAFVPIPEPGDSPAKGMLKVCNSPAKKKMDNKNDNSQDKIDEGLTDDVLRLLIPERFDQMMDTQSDVPDRSSTTSTPHRQLYRCIQDEADQKTGIAKHLSSPKKQSINKFTTKYTKSSQRSSEDIGNNNMLESCSNADTSTLKNEDFIDDFENSSSSKSCNKSVLLTKYLKSVYQRRDLDAKLKNNKFFKDKLLLEHGFPSIIYPWNKVAKNFRLSASKLSHLIDKEIVENKRISVRLLTASEPSYFDSFEDNVAIECSEKLKLQIFTHPTETLHRMLRVRSPYKIEDGSWSPLLVFITEYAMYVAEVKDGQNEYNLLCRLQHDQLDAIVMGPESQYVQIVDVYGRVACSLVTGEAGLGARLASSLEWSARTSPLRPTRPPALVRLTCATLAAALAARSQRRKVPRVLFYGRACSGEAGDRMPDVPGAFAPPLEGYLMCRTDPKRKFEPCYFLLRAGVLHWGPYSAEGGAGAGTPLPHTISLRAALGVRRHSSTTRRPHCFEIALGGAKRLVMAAPDDQTASSWLQSLLLHAAQSLEENVKPGAVRGPPPACSVLVTPHEVLSLRDRLEPAFVAGAASYLRERGGDSLLREYMDQSKTEVDILACGSIRNLTAFKIPDNDENWCILEWSVCEARERGAGLALVLASGAELERLIAAVETAFCRLTSEPFPLSVIDGDNSACSVAHGLYESAWAHMLPSKQ